MTQKNAQIKDRSTAPIQFKAVSTDALTGTLTVDESSRKISGYAAIWNNVDDAGDMLLKGCCSKSISERGPSSTTNRKIIFLWMHDVDEPLGRITNLSEDDKGLYFEAEVDKIPEGDRALIQLKSGTLNQFSIGYQYVWDKCTYDGNADGGNGAFIVAEINLFEISVVSLGCNELTGFEGMKAAELESERNQVMRDTERFLKALPYDQQLQTRQLIAKHLALATVKPAKATSQQSEPPKERKAMIDFSQLVIK